MVAIDANQSTLADIAAAINSGADNPGIQATSCKPHRREARGNPLLAIFEVDNACPDQHVVPESRYCSTKLADWRKQNCEDADTDKEFFGLQKNNSI